LVTYLAIFFFVVGSYLALAMTEGLN
jgi:hypothetical protein